MNKLLGLLGILVIAVAIQRCQSLHHTDGLANHAFKIYNELQGKAKRDLTEEESQSLLSVLELLARQTMLQDFAVQERVRTDGASGVKQRRQYNQGSKTYHSSSYTGNSIVSIHEHTNNKLTVGMGEFGAVLNGVEFRTRHNDYKLYMPHEDSSAYHAVQEIPFPGVPQSVKDKATVEEQIVEMREYFKAWRDDDISHRDYTDFFKPVLCYLEGAWTISDSDTIDESFDSDRHHIDAKNWFDLQEKIRFTGYTGKKDRLENYAYLPTQILNTEDGTLHLAQWNYRIACHPLKYNLKPSRLRLIDDIHARMAKKRNLEDFEEMRAARFMVAPVDKATWSDQVCNHCLLDQLMEEVPGMDNYKGNLTDDAHDSLAQHYKTRETLNAAYYHRWFKTAGNDAMGVSFQHRGYSDPSGFMAMTSQSNIAPMSFTNCDKDDNCNTITQRWTYAIPLEIIYMTPLNSWNPYGIEYKGERGDPLVNTVWADGRNGEEDKPYNGTNYKTYYQIPAEFFSSQGISEDSADTGKASRFVLDSSGQAHKVAAAGTRIKLPDIPGVGELRTRYPIMPVYAEDAAAWKESEALKDIVLKPITQKRMFYEDFPTGDPVFEGWTPPEGQPATRSAVHDVGPSDEANGFHTHTVTLTVSDLLYLQTIGNTVTLNTSVDNGHSHEMIVTSRNWGNFRIVKCDGLNNCPHPHSRFLFAHPIP